MDGVQRRVAPASHSGCAPAEGFQVVAETRAFLAEQGVDLSGEQQTKTKTALQYFSKNLDGRGHVLTGRSGRLSRRNANGSLSADR